MKRLFFILCLSVFAHADLFKYTSCGVASLAILTSDTSQHVTARAFDADGGVWYGMRDGSVFRTVNGTIDSASYRKIEYGQPIMAIESSPNGDVWVGADALYRYTKGIWSRYFPPEVDWKMHYRHHWVNDISVESDSVIWVASEGQGALRYTVADGKFVMYQLDYDFKTNPQCYTSMSLVAGEKGKMPVFGGRWTYGYGLYRPDSSGAIVPFLSCDALDYTVDMILGYYHDNSDRYWIVTTRGLYVGGIENPKAKFIPKNDITATIMMAIIQDVIKKGSATEITNVNSNILTNISCKLDSQKITLDMSGTADIVVYDFRGRLCFSQNGISSGTTELPTPLASGCYLIRVIQNGKTFTTTALVN